MDTLAFGCIRELIHMIPIRVSSLSLSLCTFLFGLTIIRLCSVGGHGIVQQARAIIRLQNVFCQEGPGTSDFLLSNKVPSHFSHFQLKMSF